MFAIRIFFGFTDVALDETVINVVEAQTTEFYLDLFLNNHTHSMNTAAFIKLKCIKVTLN